MSMKRINAVSLIVALLSVISAFACDVDNPPRLFSNAMKAKSLEPLSPGHSIRLLVQNGWLPQSPVLVRVEVLTAQGERDWALWDAEAMLSVDQPGVTLSTNRVVLRNGLGSALLSFAGTSTNFNLAASINGLQTNKALQSLTGSAVTRIGGTLPGSASTWSGVVLVTNDVTIPTGHTLTVLSNTLVLVNGAASGTTAPRIIVNGTLNCFGTEDYPVTFTSTNMSLNWGQIRHTNAQPSTYRYTTICKAGRATAEGHTGTGPMLKLVNSTVVFEGCNISDAIATTITNGIGKIMQADNSSVTFNNCLLTRARMGPEIAGTALLCTNSYIMEMFGPDDADGIYLHDAPQALRIRSTVIAAGDDDAVDTLGANVQVDNSIIRDFCDKGVSVLDGSLSVNKALIVDHNFGISAKSQSSNVTIPIGVNQSTIAVATNGIATINKYGGQTNVNGIYHVTNTIIRSAFSVVTDYDPANFHLRYCNISPTVSGVGNTASNNAALAAIVFGSPGITTNLPLFADSAAGDFRLLAGSPCIDAGDPASPLDPDGSPADVGYFRFVPPPPLLSASKPGNVFTLNLDAYTNRNYVIAFTTDFTAWTDVRTNFQTAPSTAVTIATTGPQGFYRARLAP